MNSKEKTKIIEDVITHHKLKTIYRENYHMDIDKPVSEIEDLKNHMKVFLINISPIYGDKALYALYSLFAQENPKRKDVMFMYAGLMLIKYGLPAAGAYSYYNNIH